MEAQSPSTDSRCASRLGAGDRVPTELSQAPTWDPSAGSGTALPQSTSISVSRPGRRPGGVAPRRILRLAEEGTPPPPCPAKAGIEREREKPVDALSRSSAAGAPLARSPPPPAQAFRRACAVRSAWCLAGEATPPGQLDGLQRELGSDLAPMSAQWPEPLRRAAARRARTRRSVPQPAPDLALVETKYAPHLCAAKDASRKIAELAGPSCSRGGAGAGWWGDPCWLASAGVHGAEARGTHRDPVHLGRHQDGGQRRRRAPRCFA